MLKDGRDLNSTSAGAVVVGEFLLYVGIEKKVSGEAFRLFVYFV